MNTGNAGISLIKSFESLSLKTYVCPGGKLTIGYGHTGSDVVPGMVISEDQADQLLMGDLAGFAKAVSNAVHVPLGQNQFDACVSLCFNIGTGNFTSSTLVKMLNADDTAGAADQFLRWNRSNNQILQGLTRRREAERALFLAPDMAAVVT